MSDLVWITQGLYVAPELDRDGALEISMYSYGDDDSISARLGRRETLALSALLSKALDDADKKQETEK